MGKQDLAHSSRYVILSRKAFLKSAIFNSTNKTTEAKQKTERLTGGYMYAVFNDNLLTGNALID